ncbi:MAG: FAD-binding protein [Burkholderiaceae bacterium]
MISFRGLYAHRWPAMTARSAVVHCRSPHDPALRPGSFASRAPTLGPYLRSGYLLRGRTPAEAGPGGGLRCHRVRAHAARVQRPGGPRRRSGLWSRLHVLQPLLGRPGSPAQSVWHRSSAVPFYAVKVVVGDLGTFAGLRTDEHSRVLDAAQGRPIEGLYAAGNDAASIMGGNYPGGGITLGPAMTFGWIAARHLASAAAEQVAPTAADSLITA